MPTELPPQIAAYVAANARLDAEGMLSAFAPDAVVFDEQRRRAGRAEIQDWIQSATIASRAIFTTDACRQDDGVVVVSVGGDGSGTRALVRSARRPNCTEPSIGTSANSDTTTRLPPKATWFRTMSTRVR